MNCSKRIERLANLARDLAKEKKVSIRTAILFVAAEQDASVTAIAQELNRRSQLKRSKRRRVKFDPETIRALQVLDSFKKNKERGEALRRERDWQKGFRLTGNLDAYR
jgi:hypothetical protein